MDARCPLCTTVFKTERTGVQFCPNCGQQVNVADVSGAAPPPPPPSSGAGPNFLPPDPSGYGVPPPPSAQGRGLTPWERRSELGFVSTFGQTLKGTLFDPVSFFRAAEPAQRVWDAILYSWILFAVSQLLFALPLRLAGVDRVETPKDLDQLPPQLRDQFEKIFAMAQEQQSPGRAVAGVIGGIIFFPVIIVILTAILHLFCLMFGAAKNGFAATLRAVCYASSPLLFGVWMFVFIAAIYNLVLTIIGISQMQQTSGGRAAGAVLSPMFVACCCCCGLIIMTAMAMAGSGMK